MDDQDKFPKVVTIGNSFGVVIPKPVCRLMKIDRTTRYKMSFEEDQRIVIRVLGRADRVGQPDMSRLTKMLTILVNHYKMRVEHFDRLSHDGTSWRAFLSDISIRGHVDVVTVARLDECLGRRRDLERAHETESWSETVDAVLLLIPNQPNKASQPQPSQPDLP